MCIQELDLKIRHRPGKSNLVADALSRHPLPVADVLQVVADARVEDAPENDIAKLQRQDDELAAIFQWLEGGGLPADPHQAQYLKAEHSNFEIIDGVLCYHHPSAPDIVRIVVPSCLRSILLKESHNGKFAGHFAEQKIYATLRGRYWWRGMRNDVRCYCRSCLVCASRKGPGRRQRPKLQPIPVGGPFHTVGVDVLQLPRSLEGNQYAIVFVDYLTKWPEVFAVPDQTADTIARLLVEEIVSRHGVPERLLSDRGPNFLSCLIEKVCQLLGTTKVNTSGYHPQCDGLVEKFNSTLINMLSKSVGKYGNDWDKRLPYVLFAYRVAVQDSTKSSPFYLLYGRHPRVPTDSALDNPRTVYQIDFDDYAEELVTNLSDAWQLAHENVRRAQAKQKAQYDKKSVCQPLSVGDRVMVHMPGQVQGKAWKFARPYFGPYEVVGITPTNAEVQLLNHPTVPPIFVSLDRVRKCYEEMTDDVWMDHRQITPRRAQPKTTPASTKETVPAPPYTGPVTRSRSEQT